MQLDTIFDEENKEFEKLFKKYSNKYFRELVILYHIDEIYFKKNLYIAQDSKPFRQIEFSKELADLAILLEIYRRLDSQFNNTIKSRIQKFLQHLKMEKEKY